MNVRGSLAFGHDVAAAAVAWCVAFWLRFNFELPEEYREVMLATLPFVVLVHGVVFWLFGLYRGLWRYASLPDLQRILVALGVALLAVPAVLMVFHLGAQVPRSVFVLAPLILAAAMCGSRLLYRASKERRLLPLAGPAAVPVLVLGAGDAAALLLKELASSRQWRALGLLDDERSKQGGEIERVKVLGTIDRVGEIAARLGVTRAVIAMPAAAHAVRKRAVDFCATAGLTVMTVPALSDIVSGKVSVSALRNVELDDLLGRDRVDLDIAGLREFLQGCTVLVTGAGGSIGSELCRQAASFGPARIILFEQSEFALYSIEQEFLDRRSGVDVVAVIGDAKDAVRMREVFSRWHPDVVLHASAYKHVPLMEDGNAFQAVRNNALGTLVVARAAVEAGTRKFVLVSTDKAVNPANVMGASKRLAEVLCQSLQGKGTTQFVVVRFGNVLGSTGSVVPRFRDQIARGGPVTVTHPEIRRYFMSIPEAAQLVLQAGQMGRGGEIYVLDMGEEVKIVDLARQMILLSGINESDIEIEFTGLRAGEKLYEEPLADAEHTLPTPHPRLRIARAQAPSVAAPAEIAAWLETTVSLDAYSVRTRLKAWIPEYVPANRAASVQGGLAPEPNS